ncbi:hypothetical protein EYR38_005114 [Pleurotus pulmonarius]|nr:hypothetical protein EYR38_005114 [Pleurotus pulmonarius]
MATSLPTHSSTLAGGNYGFELGLGGEHYFDLSAFLNAESFDEWDMEFAQLAQMEDCKISGREAAVNTDQPTFRDTGVSTRPHFSLPNAGGPPNQLLPPAPVASANNARTSITLPWSVRDDTPRDLVSAQPPNLVPSSSQADRDRGLNKAQRRELAAMRIKICKRCGVYVPGPRRLHDSHCVASDKENIDPN